MEQLKQSQYSKMDQVQVWRVIFFLEDGTKRIYEDETALWAPYDEAYDTVMQSMEIWNRYSDVKVTDFKVEVVEDA